MRDSFRYNWSIILTKAKSHSSSHSMGMLTVEMLSFKCHSDRSCATGMNGVCMKNKLVAYWNKQIWIWPYTRAWLILNLFYSKQDWIFLLLPSFKELVLQPLGFCQILNIRQSISQFKLHVMLTVRTSGGCWLCWDHSEFELRWINFPILTIWLEPEELLAASSTIKVILEVSAKI